MKKELHTETIIRADIGTVWQILTDFPAYPEWNPFIIRIGGRSEEGAVLDVRIQPVGGRAMNFAPKILCCRPPYELRWLGKTVWRGLFDGEHFFRLETLPDDTTKLTHGERFDGLLVRFAADMLDRTTLPAFEQMNQALKQRAENSL
ncbi:SRPBCC family protein [Neisseria sp.]|uniref:SRPBCC family protein n=1 Tax=Neisseria sp. TaxID=192066 RepID=UPI0035A063E9